MAVKKEDPDGDVKPQQAGFRRKRNRPRPPKAERARKREKRAHRDRDYKPPPEPNAQRQPKEKRKKRKNKGKDKARNEGEQPLTWFEDVRGGTVKRNKRWSGDVSAGLPKSSPQDGDQPEASTSKASSINGSSGIQVKTETLSDIDDISEASLETESSSDYSDDGTEEGEVDDEADNLQLGIEAYTPRNEDVELDVADQKEQEIMHNLMEEQGALEDDENEANSSMRYFAAFDAEQRKKGTHTCTRCGQPGHSIRDCNVKQCTHCGMLNDHEFRQCPKNKTCNRCGAKGHLSHTCTAKSNVFERECSICGSQRHKSAACPTIWRQYDTSGVDPAQKDLKPIIYACYNCGKTSVGRGHFGTECPKPRGHPIKIVDPCVFTSASLRGKGASNDLNTRISQDGMPTPSHCRFDDVETSVSQPRSPRKPSPRTNRDRDHNRNRDPDATWQDFEHLEQRGRWSPSPPLPFEREGGSRRPHIVNGQRQKQIDGRPHGDGSDYRPYERSSQRSPPRQYRHSPYGRSENNYKYNQGGQQGRRADSPTFFDRSDDDGGIFSQRGRNNPDWDRAEREGAERARLMEAERLARWRPKNRGILRLRDGKSSGSALPSPRQPESNGFGTNNRDGQGNGPPHLIPASIPLPPRSSHTAPLRGMANALPNRPSPSLFDRISDLPDNRENRQQYNGGYY